MSQQRYLGVRPGDLDGTPYAKFWNPRMGPLPEHALQAIAHGPVAAPRLPALAEAGRLLDPSADTLENGYTLGDDGALRVAIRTDMPGVSPAMVDWWFGWHSEEPERYKLWHPHAHVHAAWDAPTQPGLAGRARYLNRTSYVDEYVGHELGSYAISFIPPGKLGLDEARLANPDEATAICARVGFEKAPLDFGYLVHHVRRVPGGAEMRSRFWIGGPLADARRGGLPMQLAARLIRLVVKPKLANGLALLVHCSQEMSHLATFLPGIHEECRETP